MARHTKNGSTKIFKTFYQKLKRTNEDDRTAKRSKLRASDDNR